MYSLEELLELDENDVASIAGLEAPDPAPDPNDFVSTEIFGLLEAGQERVCVVLRADGLTYKSIGEIMGISEGQVKNTIYGIRKRIAEKFMKKKK